MTNTREFIESRLLNELQVRRDLEEKHFQELPLMASQLAEWYLQQGFINALMWVLQHDNHVGFHEYTSEIKIKDIITHLQPHISSHPSGCECHQCITNDVLQYFIRESKLKKTL